MACTGAATAAVLAALAPVGLGRWDYYRLLAAGNMARVAGCALVGVGLGGLGGDARPRWLARLTAGLGLASALIAAGFVGALVRTMRSHGLSLRAQPRASIDQQPDGVSVLASDGARLEADLYRPRAGSSRTSGRGRGPRGRLAARRQRRESSVQSVAGGARLYRAGHSRTGWRRWLTGAYRSRMCAAALAWLRANAAALGIEPTRIALLGRSAGGHLALLAAYMAQTDDPPAAVIAFYAPTDLLLLKLARHEDVRLGVHALVGMDPDGYRRASPLSYVSSTVPPTLLIHGTWDDAVLPEHSRRLARELTRHGAEVTVLEVPFARHAFDVVANGLPTLLAHQAIYAFLERELTPESDGTRRSIRAARPARRLPRASL